MRALWIGTGDPSWLERYDMPMMISHRRLTDRRRLPRARHPWVLDSGGFTEMHLHGEWTTTARDYCTAVDRYRAEVGNLMWAAPQDWMCEESALARSGRTVTDHIARTVDNFVALRSIDHTLPIIPVVQGWALDDYLRCVDRYTEAGVDLGAEPVVGIGSVCRRGSTEQGNAERIVRRLAALVTPRLHGFGVSLVGLQRYADALMSADSHAWSYDRRRSGPPRQHHPDCHRPPSARGIAFSPAHCPGCAMAWRRHVLAGGARPTLFLH